jgi:SAM-dependent methyltransferase
MSTRYQIAYRLGITPWERAGRAAAQQFSRLLDREEQTGSPLGQALDLGCGTGDHTIELARRGWDVTGVDSVPRAVHRAGAKASAAGVHVRVLEVDVTALREYVGTGYRFLLDIGCFHGLTPDQRIAYAREVRAVAAPGATLLMVAFAPGRRLLMPRGVGRDELTTTFHTWTLIDEEPADTSGMPAPLRRTAPRFYRLRRS